MNTGKFYLPQQSHVDTLDNNNSFSLSFSNPIFDPSTKGNMFADDPQDPFNANAVIRKLYLSM